MSNLLILNNLAFLHTYAKHNSKLDVPTFSTSVFQLLKFFALLHRDICRKNLTSHDYTKHPHPFHLSNFFKPSFSPSVNFSFIYIHTNIMVCSNRIFSFIDYHTNKSLIITSFSFVHTIMSTTPTINIIFTNYSLYQSIPTSQSFIL